MRSLAVSCSLIMLSALTGVALRPAYGGAPSAQGQGDCITEIPSNFRQSIHAEVDGHDLQLVVSARFGGAVESLTWNGKEFINIYDHGRQISYAWSMDGYSECLNPTEPGSARDARGATSTSRLLEVCAPADDRLTTRTQPAYWLAPGESGFCSGGAASAVNETTLSDFILNKTIQIGYQGLDNVIAFTAEVEVPQDYGYMQLEIPTGYLTYEFNHYYQFNPASGELIEIQSQPLNPPWSFENSSSLPPILSTPDGAYAMGAYTQEEVLSYGIYGFMESDPANTTNKWNIVLRQMPAQAGSYTYRSYAIVGTLEAVQEAMRALYALHPTDLGPPQGYVDVVNCTEIAGWAWDPKVPGQPVKVQLYRVEADGTETLLTETLADGYREDLVPVLGDNGEHGYRVEPLRFLSESLDHHVSVYAINSVPGLPSRELTGSRQMLTCEVAGASPARQEPTQGEGLESGAGGEAGPPFSLCSSAVMPLALAGLFASGMGVRKKKAGL